MHVHFEELITTRSDCVIQTLSWMGKVPDGAPDEDGWKLNRQHYYQEGWLSMGNVKGIVSATFTTCHCKSNFEKPPRTNFNLRGHKNEVILVKWNEPYQKLATCDSNGVIFVWIKHEGRWSVELINDRNSPVTDFAWSHDGRMALICYQDGFVLVGSVAGQRYWSTMLNLESATICTGIWSPNDQRVLFGTSDGHIIVMSSTGTMLAHEAVLEGAEIATMAFSCEKFNMDEQDSDSDNEEHQKDPLDTQTLAVCFRHGVIYLMSGYDDLCPKIITTGLTGIHLEWTNDGELLAVGGFIRQSNLDCCNYVQFYTQAGTLRCSVRVPSQGGKPLSGLTWGHNDKRLFLATGCYILVAWVVKSVASLQYLSQRLISERLRDESVLSKTSLPAALQSQVASLFSYTIKGNIPSPFKLREFVSLPPPGDDRLHCTMIRHGEETSGGYYTLYLEYLGGLIPLLKGKRASKIRPEFVIYDPKLKLSCKVPCPEVCEYDMFASTSESSDPDSDQDPTMDGCGSPRMRRKRRHKRCRNERVQENKYKSLDELLYDDDLPESHKLVEITSNIWGTKFKMHGLASFLPPDLGHVTYKTSLLHLQPRQMSVTITELSAEMQFCAQQETTRTSFSPHQFSEDEDDPSLITPPGCEERPNILPPVVAPVAPETCLTPSPVAGPALPVLVERHAAFIDEPVEEYFTNVDMKRSSSSEYSIHSHRLQLTKEPCASTSAAGAHEAPISEETITSLEDDSSTTPLVQSGSSNSLRGRSRSLELLYEDLKTCVNLVAECAGESNKGLSSLDSYLKIKRGSLDSKNPVIKYKGDTVRSASVPTTPTKSAKKKVNRADMLMGKHKIQSPLLQRRFRNIRLENDDESIGSNEDIFTPQHYKDLESFQKAQLKQKLRRARRGSNGFTSGLKQFVMHNKAPLWNENSQVYQLDFGGRVTQESAKNFQIEFRGKQVMQFGRIDSNAYTLDFQYPFTALQAFAVALANVTQRLK